MTSRLRLAVVVPGAVSLGAYEAGVLTALLSVIRRSEGRVSVDTIVGASAGSISGAILAHSLLTGTGDEDLENIWIRTASIDNMLRSAKPAPGRPRAPLGTGPLERAILDGWSRGAAIPASAEPIAFVVSIANLQGLRYRFATTAGRIKAVEVDTHRDRRSFLLGPETDWAEVRDAAMASGANALAFPPVSLRRKRGEYPPSVSLAEEEVAFWYTDGGTVVNEPLGLATDAVYAPHQVGLPDRGDLDGDRVFLLVHPHPIGFQDWPAEPGLPRFFAVARRALAITRRQSIHDDMRRIEETNRRLEVRRALQGSLSSLLESPTAGQEVGEAIRRVGAPALKGRARIQTVVEGGKERANLSRLTTEVGGRSPGPMNPGDLLDFVLDEATGTAGRDIASVEVVSPELDPSGRPASELLAGDALGHFFGLASEKARRSDFALGYRNFRVWWDGRARESGLDGLAPAEHPLERLPVAGRMTLRDLPLERRLKLAASIAWRFMRELF